MDTLWIRCTYVLVCVCCVYVCVCVGAVCVCVYICMYICTYVCMYIMCVMCEQFVEVYIQYVRTCVACVYYV